MGFENKIDNIVDIIKLESNYYPEVGIILGTGLGEIADHIETPSVFPYSSLPNWPESTVAGHAGRLLIGKLCGKAAFVMQGRNHFYEGYTTDDIGFPIRVMQMMGVKVLIITNASGGMNDKYEAGDVMLVSDQINYLGMSGVNPLRGQNRLVVEPRFLDMCNAYDEVLRNKCKELCDDLGVGVREGVYAGIGGPNLETAAEYRFLKKIGADAVGMSTVTEVLVARHAGIRVLGMSGITNKANLDGKTSTSLDDVLQAGKVIAPKMLEILLAFIEVV